MELLQKLKEHPIWSTCIAIFLIAAKELWDIIKSAVIIPIISTWTEKNMDILKSGLDFSIPIGNYDLLNIAYRGMQIFAVYVLGYVWYATRKKSAVADNYIEPTIKSQEEPFMLNKAMRGVLHNGSKCLGEELKNLVSSFGDSPEEQEEIKRIYYQKYSDKVKIEKSRLEKYGKNTQELTHKSKAEANKGLIQEIGDIFCSIAADLRLENIEEKIDIKLLPIIIEKEILKDTYTYENHELYRIRLHNISTESIKNVKVWLEEIYQEKDGSIPNEFIGNVPCILSSYESIVTGERQLVNLVAFKRRQNWELVDIYVGGEIGGELGKPMNLWGPVILKIKIKTHDYSSLLTTIRINYEKDTGQGENIKRGQGLKVEIID